METEKKPFSIKGHWNNCSTFAKFNWLILFSVIAIALFIMVTDLGEVENMPFGAGDYYYTDLEGFEKIFYRVSLGTEHPFLFFALFIGWAGVCWMFLKKVEKKK